LAKKLCNAATYPANKPEDLDFVSRIKKIKQKLLLEMNHSAILLLQEVDHDSLATLLQFLELNEYSHVSTSYGNAGSGYFGVLVAWPRESYKVTRMKIGNASNEKKWLSQDPLTPKTPDEQRWYDASQKKNQYIFVEFDEEFVVATYHMPCEFQDPQMMTILASNITELIFEWADGRPFVFGGDFNIKPHDFQYAMLTGTGVDFENKAMPVPLQSDPYRAGRFPGLNSAYMVLNGHEPRFTNSVQYMDNATNQLTPFAGTLDYLFFYGNLRPVTLRDLRDTDETPVPFFPSHDEPSDHLMIAATFIKIDDD
jgi:hypothetical protein